MDDAPEKKRSSQVWNAQLLCAFLAFCGGGFGIAFMIYFAQTNTCNTSGPSAQGKLGYYPPWSVLLTNNPSNCIVDCPNDCYSHYTEAASLKAFCQPCLDYCVSPNFRRFPWSTNIYTCSDDPPCSFANGGVNNFCKPLAMCLMDCAGQCVSSCLWDKYTALWTSLVSMLLLWLAALSLVCLAGFRNMTFPPIAFLALLPMIGATILLGDLWLWNMTGKGWPWLQDDKFKNVTPNYMPGLITCLYLIGCVLMTIAFWNVKNKTRQVRNKEERVVKEAVSKDEPKKTASTLLPEPPKLSLTKPQEHKVSIGIEFGIDEGTGEVFIKGIADDGPAFASIPKILIGDVVHRVWDDTDPEPVADHHWKTSIETWRPIVVKSPAGTKCWFEFFRKSENRSYTTYIVRKERK